MINPGKHPKQSMRSAALLALFALFVLPGQVGAQAGSYPARPIRFIIPFPPGGSADLLARVIGPKLTEGFGQQVVIDNRTGAGGSIGTEAAAKAAPDGYTWIMGSTGPNAMNPALYQLPYDPVRDFVPVSMVALVPSILVVNPSIPARNVGELVALARARPGQLTYASAGNGSSVHLFMELFKLMAKINMVHIPYKGGGPAMTDVIAGHVAMMFDTVPTAMPHFKAGKTRALAVTTVMRIPQLPEVPSVAESGYPGYEAVGWYGVLVPARTPPDIVSRVNSEIAKVLAAADLRKRFAEQVIQPMPSSSDAFGAFIQKDMARWARVVKDSGARVD